MQMAQREPAGPAPGRLLTAREVQERLQVDATTIYRMAADGRLPAVKVGRQWRFPREAVEAVLSGHPVPVPSVDELPEHRPLDPAPVDAVLDVSAPLLGVMMVVTDMEGNPISHVANPCPWFVEHADDAETIEACTAEWQAMADDLDFAPRFQRATLGFECARVFIRSGSELIGMVLAGGVAARGDDTAGLHQLDDSQRHAVLEALPRVSVALSRTVSRSTHDRDASPAPP